MAVVRVQEEHSQRRSGIRLSGTDSLGFPKYATTHTRSFLVWCDDITDGTTVAMTALEVPAPGDRHDQDFDAYATGINAEPLDGDGLRHRVRVDYSDESEATAETFVPPLARDWEIRWGGSESTSPWFLDYSNPRKPAVNSAGERFASMVEKESSELTLTITKNEADGNPGEDELYSNTVNTNDVAIAGTVFLAGTLKMSPIQSVYSVERINLVTYEYYRKTYQLKARRDGWRTNLIDEGFHELVTTVKTIDGTPTEVQTLREIRSEAGTRVTTPWPLDGEGKKLASFAADRVELEFRPYEETSWASRGFAA